MVETPAARAPWRVIGVVVAAFAILCGSVFAYLAVTKPDGEATPEAAVQKLFAAIDAEDAIGLLETLPPSERDVIKQPTIDIVTELQRLGILQQFEMKSVPGADLHVDGLTLATENVGSNEDLKSVKVTGGSISGSSIPSAVPIGDRLRHIITEDMGEEIDIPAESFSEDLVDAEIRMITVKEDGGWHVSLFYSIAEAIRNDEGVPPVLGNGPAPVGSATPDGALKDLVDHAVNLDLEGVIAMLPPDEMRAVYDYAPLFLPDANKGAREAKDDGFTARLDRFDTRVEGEGEVRRVFVTGFDVTIGGEGNQYHVVFDGTCIRYDGVYTYRSMSGSTSSGSSSGSSSSSSSDTQTDHAEACFDGSTAKITTNGTSVENSDFGDLGLFNGLNPRFAVTVVERGGRWYVSPTRTMFDQFVTALRDLTPEDIDQWGRTLAEQQKKSDERSKAYSDCSDARNSGSSSNSQASIYRESYLENKAYEDCLRSHGVDSSYSYRDECFAAYEKLATDASESEWRTADAVVEQCEDERYGSSSSKGTTPTTSRSSTTPGTSRAPSTTTPKKSTGTNPPRTTTTTAAPSGG